MTELQLTNADANKATRGTIATALGRIPDLAGTTITGPDFETQLDQVNRDVLTATDVRVANAISTAVTDCYNALRTALTNLNETLETEFTAI